jgi:hypothetical protein
MWLERKSVLTRSGLCVVTQNWATLQTVEWRYLGQGRRRWWWPLLPELLRKYVSAYSRP